MRVRRALKSFAVIGAAMAALFGASQPAHAAAGWGMSWGASQTESTIQWTSGYSAYVDGYIKAVSGYREVCFQGNNGDYWTGEWCYGAYAGQTTSWSDANLRIAVPGGVQRVYAYMYADGGWVHEVFCTRSGCTRVY
ncbi:hypothetical protein [Streptomyces sp. RFCAC02]|uniref:hypothetical protein n=1 Tax=Streptomyces sp. RFCAC02 TaxID=2499143 RepID=UPI00101F2099|nr:hypothetical protein [Streptomyces sp. RFCAC02]